MSGRHGPLDGYFRAHVRALEPYVPPEALAILARRHGLDPARVAKLDFNENPYGPSPAVRGALAELPNVHLYPDPVAGELVAEIARYAEVAPERVFVGAGADELIHLLVAAFVDPGDAVLDMPPTYGMYGGVTRQHAGRVLDAPRTDDWRVDVTAALDGIERGVKLTWLCSPNNPTGQLAAPEEVLPLLARGAPVVVDEAYYEFSAQTYAPLLGRYLNLVVMRTFSKLAGLAGLRVAYLLADPAVVAQLHKIKLPFNTSLAAQAAALAALRDRPWLDEVRARLLGERDRMIGLLREQGELEPYPTDANFVLCRVRGGDAAGLHAALAAEGVFVRHFKKPRIEDCLRISVGRPEDTDRLLAALHRLRGKTASPATSAGAATAAGADASLHPVGGADV